MARRTQIVLEDDLTGGPADETVAFAIDGTWYEIDLNSKNAEAFRELLSTYVAAGRRKGSTGSGDRPGGARISTSNTKHVRDWASSQGMAVPARGRLPRSVLEAYDAARQASG